MSKLTAKKAEISELQKKLEKVKREAERIQKTAGFLSGSDFKPTSEQLFALKQAKDTIRELEEKIRTAKREESELLWRELTKLSPEIKSSYNEYRAALTAFTKANTECKEQQKIFQVTVKEAEQLEAKGKGWRSVGEKEVTIKGGVIKNTEAFLAQERLKEKINEKIKAQSVLDQCKTKLQKEARALTKPLSEEALECTQKLSEYFEKINSLAVIVESATGVGVFNPAKEQHGLDAIVRALKKV